MNASVSFDPLPQRLYAGPEVAGQRSRFQWAFRRARRHSRIVRLLRFGLPASVVAVVGLYGLGVWLNPLAGLSLPQVGKLVISGSRITMEVPRLAGFTRDGRAYELTAKSAAQDLRSPEFIELKEVRARIDLENASTVNITAESGSYDTKSEGMMLRDNVVVRTTTGTEVRLHEASMDLRKGAVVSNKPVEVDLPSGRVRANALEITEGGSVVLFRGGVTTWLQGSDVVAGGGKPEAGR